MRRQIGSPLNLSDRLSRDGANAARSQELAAAKKDGKISFQPAASLARSAHESQLGIKQGLLDSAKSFLAIANDPFHAMVEAQVDGSTGSRSVLWYANEHTATNEFLEDGPDVIQIMCWTHPALQVALAHDLGKRSDIARSGYALKAVTPLARARFKRTLPTISGLYEPGGMVADDRRTAARAEPDTAGLKAVKLTMTAAQVEAFIARMDGYMLISGAPGTGKTTVAFQRIRFLFDQQNERVPSAGQVSYDHSRTRVFLANANLIEYCRQLLTNELDIPATAVSLVGDFLADYVAGSWRSKGGARLRIKQLSYVEARAREALLNLCKAADLNRMWGIFESQVRERLTKSIEPDWIEIGRRSGSACETLTAKLLSALGSEARVCSDPKDSVLRMDPVYERVRPLYVQCRTAFEEDGRRRFDSAFARWLYWVYDPLDALATFVRRFEAEGVARIRNGTGEIMTARQVIAGALADFGPGRNAAHQTEGHALAESGEDEVGQNDTVRHYGIEELGWLAWLLRFALPEQGDASRRFAEIPSAFHALNGPRLTHVVLDEVQDLSVQEASFFASLTHPRGALTVSADFRQVVSPVHGMETPEALNFGLQNAVTSFAPYLFQKNMRQTREIGRFLQEFYRSCFQELAPFEPGNRAEGRKPQLLVSNASGFPRLIKQLMNALAQSTSVRSVALLQVDDDPVELAAFRQSLEMEGIPLAAPSDLSAVRQLILTSVERAKGLEFDACIVVGLDDLERASLNYSKNRAYVALSRPTQRLFLLCKQRPRLLQRIPTELYDYREVG
jgi:hypothetical protein